MTTSFENTIDIIIAVLFLFLFPMALINQHKDSVINIAVENEVLSFVDKASQNGYISRNMYNELNESISNLLPDYKIELEHEGRRYYRDYRVSAGIPTETPEYTGNAYELYINSYTDEILNIIYERNELYYLNKGDYFRVRLLQNDKHLLLSKGRIVRSSTNGKGGY